MCRLLHSKAFAAPSGPIQRLASWSFPRPSIIIYTRVRDTLWEQTLVPAPILPRQRAHKPRRLLAARGFILSIIRRKAIQHSLQHRPCGGGTSPKRG